MKNLNKFLDEANLFKVYLIGVIITSLFTFFLFEYVTVWLDGDIVLTTSFNFKISVGLGAIFGLMVMLIVSMGRSNSKFWNYAEQVEELVQQASTKAELVDIYKNQFQELKNLTSGPAHVYEVKRIMAILETKHRWINQ